MKKKYLVRLTSEERQRLMELVRKGKAAAYRRTHAQILLWVDEGAHGPGLPDGEAAERVGVNERTVSIKAARALCDARAVSSLGKTKAHSIQATTT